LRVLLERAHWEFNKREELTFEGSL
jgi:hypothetical protein